MEKESIVQSNIKKKEEMSEQTENQYNEDGEVILDKETSELYDSLQSKSRMVSANIMLFLNEMDKMNPADRKKIAREIDCDLDALLKKIEKNKL